MAKATQTGSCVPICPTFGRTRMCCIWNLLDPDGTLWGTVELGGGEHGNTTDRNTTRGRWTVDFDINIVYLSDSHAGGWPTFTCHLMHSLRMAGARTILLKCASRNWPNWREFGRGLRYMAMNKETLLEESLKRPTVIAAVTADYADIAGDMIEAGALIVIHDPTELKPATRDIIDRCMCPIIDRESNLDHVQDAVYIPHPYMRIGVRGSGDVCEWPRMWNAVAYSRIDWDKHTEIIAEANRTLKDPVRIFGFIGRPYAQHKLDKEMPEWRQFYYGPMSNSDLWAGARLATNARFVVDMSSIKKDGGGTQYTFLEAWDAGATLVLNQDWLTGNPQYDAVCDSAIFVSDHTELVGILESEEVFNLQDAANSLLDVHDAKHIGKEYIDLLTEVCDYGH